MKKKVLFVLAVFSVLIAEMSAAPVTRAEAQAKAQVFMQSRGIVLKGEMSAVNGPRRVGNAQNGETSSYYVFNNGQNGGFVIISGDSRTREVLAYSDKGSLDLDDMPPALADLLECYAHDINLLGEDDSSAPSHSPMYSPGAQTTTPVLPLLTSEWNQNPPFNSSCPLSGKTRTYVGCVAVAMSQILYYYRNRMPSKTQVAIPGYSNLATVKAGTAFNWSLMFDKYTYDKTSEQVKAVANLMLYAGQSISSSYGVSETSASCNSVPGAMATYFGFSSNAKMVNRTSYTYSQWEDLLINELMNARPVFFNGVSYYLNHAFVVDGYDGMGYFHANLGWGGRSDGYYSLNIFNTQSDKQEDGAVDGDAFLVKQQAILDLQPVNGYFDTPDNPELTSTINSAKNSAVTVTYKNGTNTTATFKCGLGYADADGIPQLLKEWDDGKVVIPANTSLGAVAFTLTKNDFSAKKLKTGTYEVFPIYLVDGAEDWERCPNTTSNYISVTYSSSSVVATLGTYTYSLKASDFYFSGCKLKSYTQPVYFKLTNEGDKDFFGTVYLFVSTTTTPGSYSSKTPVMLGPGQSVDVMLTFKPGYAKTYNVWIARDTGCKYVLGSSSVAISSGTYKRALKVTNVTIENSNPNKPKQIFSNKVKGTAKITNTGPSTYSDKIMVFFFRKKPGTSAYDLFLEDVKNVTIPAGDTITVNYDFGELPTNYYYNVSLYYQVDWALMTNGIWKDYYLTPCVRAYDSKGNLTGIEAAATVTIPSTAAAVDLSDVMSTVTKVVPNSNPNTLYYIGANDTAPSGLSGKNIIKGNNSTSIALTDGNPFYAPKAFTAKKATYSRTSKIGTDGNGGWEILVMPFAATKITCNSTELKWFKSDDESGKNLWIKEFSSVQGYSTVCFDYAQEIVANKPYIMAVPGTKWGDTYNLVGKKLVFSADNTKIAPTKFVVTGSDAYNFHGSFEAKHKVASYVLDSTGKNFVFKNAEITPFRGYFISTASDDYHFSNLNIASETGIEEVTMMPFAAEGEMVDVYNLNGVKVATVRVNNGSINLDGLQKGIYIINGHKLIK